MGEEAEEGPVIGLTAAIFVDDRLPGKTPETIGYSAANNRIYHENPKIGKLSLGLIFSICCDQCHQQLELPKGCILAILPVASDVEQNLCCLQEVS